MSLGSTTEMDSTLQVETGRAHILSHLVIILITFYVTFSYNVHVALLSVCPLRLSHLVLTDGRSKNC